MLAGWWLNAKKASVLTLKMSLAAFCGLIWRCSRVWNVTQASLHGAAVWIPRFDSGSGACCRRGALTVFSHAGIWAEVVKMPLPSMSGSQNITRLPSRRGAHSFWSSRVQRGVINRRRQPLSAIFRGASRPHRSAALILHTRQRIA